MRKFIILYFIIFFIPQLLFSQIRKPQWEYGVGLGTCQLFGETGIDYNTSGDFWRDIKFKSNKFSGYGFARYTPNRYIAYRLNLAYGKMHYTDAEAESNLARIRRNLSFRTNIYEISGVADFTIYTRPSTVSKYVLHGVAGIKKDEYKIYAFVGVGVFHFNPQAYYHGIWYDLQPLGTEGQGIIPGKKPYALTQINIPFGLGIRFSYNKIYKIGLELGFRKLFTDYLDDVSTKYYSTSEIRQKNGPVYGQIAAALSSRTYEVVDTIAERGIYNNYIYDPTGNSNSKRGNPKDNDSYSFLTITFSYTVTAKKYVHKARF